MNQVTTNHTPLKSANSIKIAKNELYFVLSVEQITWLYACKKKLCSPLSLFPLYKNEAGFTDIIHIEVEKNFNKLSNCVKMIYTDVRKKKKDYSEIKPQDNRLTNENA